MDENKYYNEATSVYQTGDDFISNTDLEGVFLINRPFFSDERGFFKETFRKDDLEKRTDLVLDFVQGNHSFSEKGTLRGIHIAPWHKLITVTSGEVQQVVVDLRPDSPSFGQYKSWVLGEGSNSIFIPAGFGNGYLVLSSTANYTYLVTDYWSAGREKSVFYNDPFLGIAWRDKNPKVSEKDRNAGIVKTLFKEKF